MNTNFTIMTEGQFHKVDSQSIGKLLSVEMAKLVKDCTDSLEAVYKYSDVTFSQVSENYRMITLYMSNKSAFKTVVVYLVPDENVYTMTILRNNEPKEVHRFNDLATLVGNLKVEDAQIISVLNKVF